MDLKRGKMVHNALKKGTLVLQWSGYLSLAACRAIHG